jgi:hypothetical protein
MTKYEYKIVYPSGGILEEHLNELGVFGWKLISVMKSERYSDDNGFAVIFMREKAEVVFKLMGEP